MPHDKIWLSVGCRGMAAVLFPVRLERARARRQRQSITTAIDFWHRLLTLIMLVHGGCGESSHIRLAPVGHWTYRCMS
jgi:hypothetical protein